MIIRGLTFETTPFEKRKALVDYLKSYGVKLPTVRLIWQPEESAGEFFARIEYYSPHCNLLICIYDSTLIGKLSLADIEFRTRTVLNFRNNEFFDHEFTVEILNEGGGDWLGEDEEVIKKATLCQSLCTFAGIRTAATFYLSDNLARFFDFAKKSFLKPTYVFISWYPNWTPKYHPDWRSIFLLLSDIFPKSLLGFGEFGPQPKKAGIAERKKLIREIHTLKIVDPNYCLGGFYWNAADDFTMHGILRDTLINYGN